MQLEMISTGEEVLSGQITDTNAAWFADTMMNHGIELQQRSTVGDRMDDLVRIFTERSQHADVILVNGGLGPTSDDLSAEAMAKAAGVPLVEDSAWRLHLEDWFARRGRFGDLPGALRGVATILLPFFVIFTFFAFLSSPLLWEVLKPFGLTRSEVAPVSIFAAVGLFGIGIGWIFLRGFFRWIGGRFQHHGVGIGLGPVYLYFRKRTPR